jgi:hypothetical protein
MIKKGLALLLIVPLLAFFSCSKENYLIWKGQMKGEIYDAIICVNDNKLIVTSENAVDCYSLDKGIHEWKNEQAITFYTPLFTDDVLMTGSKNGSGIYSIDINTGEYRKKLVQNPMCSWYEKEMIQIFFC